MQLRRRIFEMIQQKTGEVLPRAEAVLFGSAATGISLEDSDIDLLIYEWVECRSEDHRQEEITSRLRLLEKQFELCPEVTDIHCYLRATVPILTFYAAAPPDQTDCEEVRIKVDISIELRSLQTNFGYQATMITKHWLGQLPALSPLVILAKHLLHKQALNRVYTGGISSYTLFVMVAAFVKDYGANQERRKHFSCLLLELLEFYGSEFNPAVSAIQLNPQFESFIELPLDQSLPPLSVLDPLNGRLMTSNAYQFRNIQFAFLSLRTKLINHREKLLKALETHF
jgi:non-canonical poly(A) RNA polymerase PAPD5/7